METAIRRSGLMMTTVRESGVYMGEVGECSLLDSAHDGRAFIIKESPIQAAVFTIYPYCRKLCSLTATQDS